MDRPTSKPCQCTGTPSSSAAEGTSKLVKAQVPQDYQAKFNLRIVPGRSLDGALVERCKPRGNRQGWGSRPLAIDETLIPVLQKADKAMVAWLAKSPANAKAFLANPVAAMREAGIKLSRAEEKALVRSHAAAAADRVVGPGVNVVSLNALAFVNGRIGRIGPSKPDGKGDTVDCGPRRKG